MKENIGWTLLWTLAGAGIMFGMRAGEVLFEFVWDRATNKKVEAKPVETVAEE